MRLHGMLESSAVNGPGDRAVVWFQGCALGCSGCHNPATHTFHVPDTPLAGLREWLLNLDGISGVTFSGGEPMQHYGDLLRLVWAVRMHRPELSIGMFTGYTQQELSGARWHWMGHASFIPGHRFQWEALRGMLDFAVMGRFNAAQLSPHIPLTGSANQQVALFSNRYTLADFAPQATEVTISGDGLVRISGFPGSEFLTAAQSM